MKTVKQGDAVLIPVRSAPAFDLSSFRAEIQARPSLPIRVTQRDPRQEIRERLSAAGIPVERAPRRWERIGDVLVLRFPLRELREARAIAKIFGTVLRDRPRFPQLTQRKSEDEDVANSLPPPRRAFDRDARRTQSFADFLTWVALRDADRKRWAGLYFRAKGAEVKSGGRADRD